jgi:carbamoyltransferase
MKVHLGLNGGKTQFSKNLKDGGASLISADGEYLSSIAEERVKQIKAYGGYKNSLKELIEQENIRTEDVLSFVYSSCCESECDIGEILNKGLPFRNGNTVSHHLSHASYAYALSGFDEAIVAVWDCGGNCLIESGEQWWEQPREQQTYYIANQEGIRIIDRDFSEPFDMGFGEVYRSLAYLLGFDSYIHSSKAMSLTSFGDKARWKEKTLFTFKDGKISSPFLFNRKDNYKYLIKWAKENLGINIKRVQKDEDLSGDILDFAAFIQRSMENAAILKLDYLMGKHSIYNICLSGGVALNCVMNSEIRNRSRCQRIFIGPASGDTGQSIGNAIHSYFLQNDAYPNIKKFTYIGTKATLKGKDISILEELKHIKLSNEQEKISIASQLLNRGFIIGWCQGKSESGPRALGNRSILCRPDLKSLEDKLRNEIKGRKWYEPFAATILKEEVSKYFDSENEHPFMLEVVKAKDSFKDSIRSCLHSNDGTCRLQTVSEENNATYYALIKEFFMLSGIPVVLNTSLNKRGRPIAETATDSIDFFLTSNLQYLFVDDYLIYKNSVKEELLTNMEELERTLSS